MIYNNIARVYQKQNKFEKAMEYMNLVVDFNNLIEDNEL